MYSSEPPAEGKMAVGKASLVFSGDGGEDSAIDVRSMREDEGISRPMC